MSKHAAAGAEGAGRKIYSAYDDPGTAEEISRRTFMTYAVNVVGAVIGVGLVIPIIGSLLPTGSEAKASWEGLTADELKELEAATNTPVKMTFNLVGKDSYLPEQTTQEYVWGIKTSPEKFRSHRPDVYTKGPNAPPDVPYDAINMGFVIFSPICPHLGCRYVWDASGNKFACPCHGSQYTFLGEHIAGPANRGLDPLPFQEKSGQAEIQWIRYKSTVSDRIVISYTS